MFSMGGDSEVLRSPTGNDATSGPLSSRSSPTTEGSAGNMGDPDLDWFFPDGGDLDDYDESGAAARNNNRRGLGDEDVRAIIATEGMRERERLNPKGKQMVSEGEVRQARRLLTNKRERWRQQLVNEASTNLRQLIPTFPPDKKLSKHDVLRYSGRYIVYLQHQLTDMLEQQQVHSGEHPSVAKKNALAAREHQDWQFASMYNHLPLNSVNAATMISATTAYGQATSNLLRERRSTFGGRSYPAGGLPSSGDTTSVANAQPTQRSSPVTSPVAGGFPGPSPQHVATIPTPVLLTAGNQNTGAPQQGHATSGQDRSEVSEPTCPQRTAHDFSWLYSRTVICVSILWWYMDVVWRFWFWYLLLLGTIRWMWSHTYWHCSPMVAWHGDDPKFHDSLHWQHLVFGQFQWLCIFSAAWPSPQWGGIMTPNLFIHTKYVPAHCTYKHTCI